MQTMSDDSFGKLHQETASQPFSMGWAIASVIIFTVLEIAIAVAIAPLSLAAHLASRMVQMRIEMLMHLLSFYVGGIFVGIISPRVRLVEPAVGAFCSVALVFMISFFMPTWYLHFRFSQMLVGGLIAFGLAIAGAYTGEKWMGNVGEGTRRAKVRDAMWGDHGLLSRGDQRFVVKPPSSRSLRS
jgi:hypothetical protein